MASLHVDELARCDLIGVYRSHSAALHVMGANVRAHGGRGRGRERSRALMVASEDSAVKGYMRSIYSRIQWCRARWSLTVCVCVCVCVCGTL